MNEHEMENNQTVHYKAGNENDQENDELYILTMDLEWLSEGIQSIGRKGYCRWQYADLRIEKVQ